MGAFAEVFGIRPWEWDQLPADEALGLMHYIDERQRQYEKAGGE